MSRTRTNRRPKQNRSAFLSVAIIVMILVGVLSYRCMELYAKTQDYEAQEADLEQQLEDQQQRAEDIEEYKTYTGTDAFVEEIARDKLGLVYPGEIVFRESDEDE